MLSLRHVPALAVTMLAVACGPRRHGHQPQQSGGDSLVLLFTGDVLLDRGIRPVAARHGGDWLFARVEPLLHQADAAVANLECPLTQVASPLGKRFIFRADTCMASVMRRAGITHATLANNHTNDQGAQGLRATVSALERAGITPAGWGTSPQQRLSPVVIHKGDVHAALFCAVLFPLENWMPDPSCAAPCQTDAATLAQAMRAYRQAHPSHHLICVVHWGVEFQSVPAPQQVRQARVLAAAGADAIIGHHPHVVQPMCRVQGTPVFYSLGNFIFDQHTPAACRGQMARIVIRGDSLSASSIPVRLRQCRPEPE